MSMAAGWRSDGPTPEAAAPLPLKGAEARGSKPTCVGLDGPRNGRVLRPCGLQGTPADRQSRIRGVRLAIPLHDAFSTHYFIICAEPLTVALTSPLPASVGKDSSTTPDAREAFISIGTGGGCWSLVATLTSRTL